MSYLSYLSYLARDSPVSAPVPSAVPSALELLELLHGRGLSLSVRGEQLVLRGPASKRNPLLVDACRARKAELLALLTPGVTHPCTGCGRFAFASPRLCWWCGSTHPGTTGSSA